MCGPLLCVFPCDLNNVDSMGPLFLLVPAFVGTLSEFRVRELAEPQDCESVCVSRQHCFCLWPANYTNPNYSAEGSCECSETPTIWRYINVKVQLQLEMLFCFAVKNHCEIYC